MSSTDPAPAAKALQYAEGTLGVNEVFKEAVDLMKLLDTDNDLLVQARENRRLLEEDYKDAEMIVTANEWGEHPDFSATKMESHLKGVKQKDASLRAFRHQLIEAQARIDMLELSRSATETQIRIAVARMTELGGYFNYLAAVKQNQRNQ